MNTDGLLPGFTPNYWNKSGKYNIKKIAKRIKKYYDSQPKVEHNKDFYNFFDHTFTCGKCRKTMSPLKSLIHWHIK